MGANSVELDAVGKRYQLGEHHGAGRDLRETINAGIGRVLGRRSPPPQDVWSLKDVSFEVAEGQAIGVIGSNGAGKSTLLKVISNITTPTEGCSRTRGRVGSLLEVGTGFHPELTGRENTYLNGAILGMSRRDVDRRLDEIVEFAGIGPFLDTPVKRYSSGMFLRLGFAVAAHIEADVLLVDEVLAVGDAEFQRRCLGKMSEIEQSGRTVIFVSHNMEAMMRLCPNVVWLERGKVKAIGPTAPIVESYLSTTVPIDDSLVSVDDPSIAAQIRSARLVDGNGSPCTRFTAGAEAWIEIEIDVHSDVQGLDMAFIVSTSSGVDVLEEGLSDSGTPPPGPGRHVVRTLIPPVFTPGQYGVGLWLGTRYDDFSFHERALSFAVEGEARAHAWVMLGTTWETRPLTN